MQVFETLQFERISQCSRDLEVEGVVIVVSLRVAERLADSSELPGEDDGSVEDGEARLSPDQRSLHCHIVLFVAKLTLLLKECKKNGRNVIRMVLRDEGECYLKVVVFDRACRWSW